MINAQLLRDDGILIVSPEGKLEAVDFQQLSLLADPYIDEHGSLTGILIDAEHFYGWEDFASLLYHIKFINRYEEKVRRVAAVTDIGFLVILPAVSDFFVSAELRHFSYEDRDKALNWLRTGLNQA